MKKHLLTHIFRWIVLSIFLFCAVLSDADSISTLTGTEWLIYELNNPYFICYYLIFAIILIKGDVNTSNYRQNASTHIFLDILLTSIFLILLSTICCLLTYIN